ncbi:hypothetical protein A9299_07785 [Moraxella osloensis]|jgi:O-acetylserine/cysteine efflux transporter|uniref:EamA family transporter n=1 Tax=Faucicola osloensis TaxID=34062 RepID=A0A1B8Q7N1_FAUOS|nr:EamA family transporter [Moraxella osloensis]OBX65797.1 hypothetical protein A9299_07785 [Moraxella osloensis]QHG10752.1 EamA family transporter [Moraxella osloensis]
MGIKDKLLAVLVVMIWGFNFVVIRWGIETVHPMVMTMLRFILTAFPMILFVKKPDVPMKFVVLYGTLFGAAVWGLVNFAVFYGMPAGMASLLLQLSPFLSVIAATVFFNERVTRVKFLGIVIALTGFILVCRNKADHLNLLNIGLMLVAALFWTVCNMIIKYTKPQNVISFTVWSSAFVPIPMVVLAVIYVWFFNVDTGNMVKLPSLSGWLSIAFQAVVTTLFGYGAWAYLISKNGLSHVAPYSLLVPVSGLFFGYLLYNEQLQTYEIVGSGLILIGLLFLAVNTVKVNKSI